MKLIKNYAAGQTYCIHATRFRTGGHYSSSGSKLNRTGRSAEQSEMAGRVRRKAATDRADALCDTEILYPILHPVILWYSARAKSLWMGFNLSLLFFFLLSAK